MEFNIFIAPITMIAVEMAKRAGLESKYLAFVAVVFGALFGAIYGFIYKGDIFVNAFEGLLYGASASGMWDVATKTLKGGQIIMAYTIIDRRGSALGGQRKDRNRSAITTIGWHYSAVMRKNRAFITNHEAYWRDTLGWDRGGYHFYIDADANIWQNYDYERITWGVYNNNGYVVHISVEAGNGNDYSPEQVAARDWLTRKIMADLNIPASKVKGHNEIYNNSSCPGYTKAQMDAFRAKLAQPVAVAPVAPEGVTFSGQSHVQQKGWLDMVNNTLGTVGQGLRLEAFSLVVKNNGKVQPLNGSIHVQDIGNVAYNQNTNLFGTVGQAKRIEAILINVGNGVQYRAHTANIGWGPWVKSGEWAGTKEMGLQIEAIEFRVA